MFNRLKNYLVVVFGISTVEAKGLVVIYIFILLLLVFSILVPWADSARYDSYLTDKRILDSIETLMGKESIPATRSPENPIAGKSPVYFRFDPNAVSGSELESLGFPKFLSERLHRFRNSGGRFKIKKDLLKIYGMTDDLYLKLEPYIQLPEAIPDRPASGIRKELPSEIKTIPEKFDINLADSSRLVSVNGIGPVLAVRIIRYRARLGGFVSLGQFAEIYGLKEPYLGNLKNSCFIGEGYSPARIKINFADWADLVKHPYFDKNTANMIIRHRDAAGPFHSLEDVRKISGMQDSTVAKIGMYIEF